MPSLLLWSSIALVLVACCVTASDATESQIVAGRIERCEHCRMQELPDVSRFLEEMAPLYEALEITEGSLGEEPSLFLLNAYRDVVRRVELSRYRFDEIIALLSESGLFVWSKPHFLPRHFTPRDGCVAWRQTSGCVGGSDQPREPLLDEPCYVRIRHDRSGYCECEGEGRTVALDCDHDEGSCAQFCDRL